jgi:hypothetical protein
MNALAAECGYGRRRAIAACFAPTARCPVHRCRARSPARQALLRAVRHKLWPTLRSNPRATGWVAEAAPCCVVDSSRRHCCRLVRADAYSSRHLDHRSHLDGGSVHPECETMRSYSLPLHGTLLPRHDRAGSRAWLGCGFGCDFWMDCVGRHHCRRQQAHLVGDRAGMGKIRIPSSLANRLLCDRPLRQNG